MAKGSSGPASEYDGTASDGAGISGNDSGAIDPKSIDGSGDGNSGGSIGSGSEQFDPAIHIGPDKRNKDGSFRRKRKRRKSGSGSKSNAKAANDLNASIDGLSKTLVIVHTGLAAATSTPEFAIDKDEGDLLASAAANVLDQFDLTPDPKTQAIVGMVMASATVYGPRYAAVRIRKKVERESKKAETAEVYSADGRKQGDTTYTELDPSALNSGADNAGTI